MSKFDFGSFFKELGEFIWEAIKEVEWRKLLYEAWIDIIKPKLEEYVKDTSSKWDDVMLAGLDRIIEKFLKPEA